MTVVEKTELKDYDPTPQELITEGVDRLIQLIGPRRTARLFVAFADQTNSSRDPHFLLNQNRLPNSWRVELGLAMGQHHRLSTEQKYVIIHEIKGGLNGLGFSLELAKIEPGGIEEFVTLFNGRLINSCQDNPPFITTAS